MKVLYIDVNCKHSSTGQIVYSLFSNCKKNGIEASVCYGRGPKIKEDGIYKFGLDWETKFHALMTRLTGYMGKFSPLSTKRLIKHIKKFKPDIVHIHELHSYFVNIKTLLLFLKKQNIKTIFTNHCEFLYTGKCGHAGKCTKYQTECDSCPLKKEYPSSLFFDRTRKMFLEKKNIFSDWDNYVLTAPSNWLLGRMKYSFFSKDKILLINNGINVSHFIPSKGTLRKKLFIPDENKIVLTAAPNLFSELKGGYRFLSIAKAMEDEKITFLAVGANGNDNTLDCPKNTIIIPLVKDKKELVEFYSNADCFVICSKNENYPTTSLEAQCCGTKVVGYDAGGVGETILEGHGGVVEYNAQSKLIELIRKTVDNAYNHQKISDESKDYFSEERMFKQYLELYKRLCD